MLTFRSSDVYGSIGPVWLSSIAADRVLRGPPTPTVGDGERLCSLEDVRLFAAGTRSALTREMTTNVPANLLSGHRCEALGVVRALADLLGDSLECLDRQLQAEDIRYSQSDRSRQRALVPDLDREALRNGFAATPAAAGGQDPLACE
jgi:hypothetical protein